MAIPAAAGLAVSAVGSMMGGKGGKGGGAKAATIDPGPAIEAFHRGADVIEQQFPGALTAFQIQSTRGTMDAIDSFTRGSIAGLPFSDAAKASMKELRSFVGLAPASESAQHALTLQGLTDQAKAMSFGGFGNSGNYTNILQTIQGKMDLAEGLTNPAERAQARQEVVSMLSNLTSASTNAVRSLENARIFRERNPAPSAQAEGKYARGLNARLQRQYDEKFDTLGRPTTYQTPQGVQLGFKNIADPKAAGYYTYDPSSFGDISALGQISDVIMRGKADNSTIQQAGAIAKQLESFAPQLQELAQRYQQDYTDELPQALTGKEIQAKLEDLPEYQFQFGQGQKALERSQAARGVLQSGGALLEAQKFGQDLAQNVYQGHVSRLAGIAGMNLPVVQQGIGNYNAQGQFYANQGNLLGATTQQSMQDVARSRESAFTNQGNALLQAAMANAQMQQQANMANAQMQQQSAGGLGKALGSIGGMMGGGSGGGGSMLKGLF